MKILITSIVDLINSQHNRPHQFVRYLSKNHEVTVLCINDWWKAGQDDLKDYSRDFDEVFKRTNIIHLTERKISPIFQEMFFSKRVKEVIKEGFDVHLNYNTLASGYIASKKINTVYDLSDDLGAMIGSSPQIPKLLRPVGKALGNRLLKRNVSISEMVTVTTNMLIESCCIPKHKSKIVPNGVDTKLFRDYGCTKREELCLDSFVIGYVGVLREWVDLAPIFLALKSLSKDIKLLVVGKEGRFEENKELAKQYGVDDRVIFTGMVPYSRVPEFISAMNICLIPFKKGAISENALPLKLFEYMACSRPVICTELSGVKRAVHDSILYANNAEDYVNRISDLYNDEQLRIDMGNSGRKIVELGYDWSELAENMEGILIDAAVNNN
jgi:glycosyltransferase involved in cell wall biosynthesis